MLKTIANHNRTRKKPGRDAAWFALVDLIALLGARDYPGPAELDALSELYRYFMPTGTRKAVTSMQWLASACDPKEIRPLCHYPYQDTFGAWGTDGCRAHIIWGDVMPEIGVYDAAGVPVEGDNRRPVDLMRVVPELRNCVELLGFNPETVPRKPWVNGKGELLVLTDEKGVSLEYVRDALAGIVAPIFWFNEGSNNMRIDSGDGTRSAVILGVRL